MTAAGTLGGTRRLDSAAIHALMPVVEPVVYQRAANSWLNKLIDAEVPFEFSRDVRLSPFEMLRGLLRLSGGHALIDAALVDALTARYGTAQLQLDIPHGIRVWETAQVLGAHNVAAAAEPSLESRVREVGYTLREELRRARRTPPPRREKGCFVLAVPRMPGHVNDLLPVASSLRASGQETIFAAGPFAQHVTAAGFTLLPHDAAPARLIAPVAARLLAYVARALRRYRDGTREDHLLAAVVTREVRRSALVMTHVVLGLATVLDNLSPSVVVAGNPYTLEGRTAALLARARGTPSAALEHGTIFLNDPAWERCPVDRVLVWGEPSRRALLSSGLKPTQIAVVGAPRTDAFVGRQHQSRPRRVLVASSGGGDQVSHGEHSVFIETVFAAAERTPDVEWIVKLHTKDRPELYAPAAARHPLAKVDVVTSDGARGTLAIFDHLSRARALITVVSTSALDAMVVGVPVIAVLVDPARTPERLTRVEFLSRRAVRQVADASELADAVLDAMDGGSPEIVARAEVYAGEHYANRGAAAAAAAGELTALAGGVAAGR